MQYAHAGEQGCVGNWTHTNDLQPWSTHLLEGGGVSRVPYWRQPTAAPTLTCIIGGSTLSVLLLEATAPLLMTSTMAGQRVRMCSRNESRASGTSLGQDGLRVKAHSRDAMEHPAAASKACHVSPACVKDARQCSSGTKNSDAHLLIGCGGASFVRVSSSLGAMRPPAPPLPPPTLPPARPPLVAHRHEQLSALSQSAL